LHLTAVFLVGILFYLYRDGLIVNMSAKVAWVSLALAAALMYRDIYLADAALTTLGAVFLFWLAFKANLAALQKINDDWDISYGTYLYGWPAAVFTLWLIPDASPLVLAAVALPASLFCGALSWWGVERWTKDINKSRSTAAYARKEPLSATVLEEKPS
jgi:peptidoglycan/LPS O-acetylase OafA/YrhL